MGAWGINVIPVALVAILTFAPWAFRDWVVFGSPFPGQVLTNALSLDGRDIFAWQDQPTLARYLAAGPAKLLELRWTGTVHNLTQVLLLLGRAAVDRRADRPAGHRRVAAVGCTVRRIGRVLRRVDRRPSSTHSPLLLFSVITFLVASLIFPVSTTWGTFLHAAGAIHVLLVISALLVLDRVIGWVGRRRGWTEPRRVARAGLRHRGLPAVHVRPARRGRADVARAGPALRGDRRGVLGRRRAGPRVDLAAEPGPVITDFPIWFAEETRHHALALPNEPIESVLDLARSFDPPARLLVVDAANQGVFPAAILDGEPGADCFVPVELPALAAYPGELDSILVFRIRCP